MRCNDYRLTIIEFIDDLSQPVLERITRNQKNVMA
jgi:hypothetical protein